MDVFLSFPQTWQFPLSSHDFGQVCGLINKYLLKIELNMKRQYSMYSLQGAKNQVDYLYHIQ